MCRIHLGVETIADVCNAAGTHITREALDCEPEAITSSPSLWPNQPRPGDLHWKEWRQLLQRLCKDGSTELITPLGKWTAPMTRKNWEAYVDYESQVVIVRQPSGVLDKARVTGENRQGWTIEVADETATEDDIEFMCSIPTYSTTKIVQNTLLLIN
jgi:hypothetical protein